MGLEDQPGFRLGLLAADDDHRALGGEFKLDRCRGEQFPHPDRISLVHAGLRAAGTTIDVGQRVEDPLAGGTQHPGQFMDPQAFGQILLGRRGLPQRRWFGKFLVVIIIGHVISSSPRARPATRPREGFRCVPGGFTGLVDRLNDGC